MRFAAPHVDGSSDSVGWVPEHVDAPRGERARLAWMRPEAFLRLVDPSFSPDPERLEFLREQALLGKKFAPLMVWPEKPRLRAVLRHEGRHRAHLARELGLARVPVLIMRPTPEHWSRRRR